MVFESRHTILDRPAWRDDAVGIEQSNYEYMLRIIGVMKKGESKKSKKKSIEEVYDEVIIPNLR